MFCSRFKPPQAAVLIPNKIPQPNCVQDYLLDYNNRNKCCYIGCILTKRAHGSQFSQCSSLFNGALVCSLHIFIYLYIYVYVFLCCVDANFNWNLFTKDGKYTFKSVQNTENPSTPTHELCRFLSLSVVAAAYRSQDSG